MNGEVTQVSDDKKQRPLWDKLLTKALPDRALAQKLAEELNRLEAFSATVPLDYCGWGASGITAQSPHFAKVLGVAAIRTINDIQTALDPADAAALEALYDRLIQKNESFELSLHTKLGRAAKIFGKRSGEFTVLWLLDVTEFAAAARSSIESANQAEKREAEWRGLLNALPFPVWLRDMDLNVIWCNRAYADVVDDTTAAVIADQKDLPLKETIKSGLSPRILAQRSLATLQPQAMRAHMIVGGQRKLVEITETRIKDENRVMGMAKDVTKEEEWQVSYDRLGQSHREGMEQLRTAIAMFDGDTRLEFYNAAYEQLTGMSGTFLDSKPKIVEIIDKMRELRKLPEQADFKQYKQQWLQRFTSLLEPYEEMQYLPDGSVVRMVIIPRPMGGIYVTQEDVTSRLRLESSYNTLMAVQQETMDNLSEGIAVFGEDGRLRLSNESFGRIWNIPQGDMKDSPHVTRILDRMHAFFDDKSWPDIREAILSNALEREQKRGRLTRNNGTILEFSVVPLPDGNILNAWFDVTASVRVEQALIDKNTALEAAEKLKTDFLANVSYQLRTPLNAIMGFAEMLNQQYVGSLNDRQKEYTGSMIEAGQRLVSLINDILDLSSIEAGLLNLHREKISLKTLARQVADLTEAWARQQKIEMAVECTEDVTVFADERRIKQVLLNLISNAINYSPNGGVITIGVKKVDGFAEVSVRDRGLGISPDDLKKIFTPFEKVRDGKIQRRSGAGLGLALVKSIVEIHGGKVAIDSREGAGTVVIFRLPLGD